MKLVKEEISQSIIKTVLIASHEHNSNISSIWYCLFNTINKKEEKTINLIRLFSFNKGEDG